MGSPAWGRAAMDSRGPAPSIAGELGLSLDPARAADLRRMKRIATGFLAAAAAVFLATFWMPADARWVGFVRIASEAGMIGGLADWFAVTALFRRPLGLPIPHTALIPTRKDAMAAQLGAFVTGHFLTRDVVRTRLAEARLVALAGSWLAVAHNAATVSRELATAAAALLRHLPDSDALTAMALDLAKRTAARTSYAPALGRMLAELVENERHAGVVDDAATAFHTWLSDNRDTLVPRLKAEIEKRPFMIRLLLRWDISVNKLVDEAIAFTEKVAQDRDHGVRVSADDYLLDLAQRLQHDEQTRTRVDELLRRSLDSARTREMLSHLLTAGTGALREALDEEGGALRRRLTQWISAVGRKMESDGELQDKLEHMLEQVALHVVDNHAGEFTRLVEDTVNRWDAAETSARIENAVGRDLQFIRINGTIVGALAGVAIHAISLLLT